MPDAPSDVLLAAMLAALLLVVVLVPVTVRTVLLARQGRFIGFRGPERFSEQPRLKRRQQLLLGGALLLLIALCLALIGNAALEIRSATRADPEVCVYSSTDSHGRRSSSDTVHTSCGDFESEVLSTGELTAGRPYLISSTTYSGLFGTERYATRIVPLPSG